MSNTIILTGAICPSYPVRRGNSYIRLMDYLCAIRRWLDVTSLERVIFCDSSACHIPQNIFSTEKFESLSFDATHLARRYEAGRGEAETIRFILENSRHKFKSFYKCTGRLFVKNFEEIHRSISSKIEMDLFLRIWQTEAWMNEWADTRFFRMKSDTYQRWISPRIHELKGIARKGYVIESLFYEYYCKMSSFIEPAFVGHNGHDDFFYDEEFSENEMNAAKKIIDTFGISYFVGEKGDRITQQTDNRIE